MSEPKDLLLIIEQLRRSNRRWKALALGACATLILAGFLSVVAAERARRQTEAALRAEREARVAALSAANAARPEQPR
jgi:cytochrome c-type biogenesis protein CcmH/NrfF